MLTRVILALAVAIAITLPSPATADAGPTDKARGNAYAWGLYKHAAAPANAPSPAVGTNPTNEGDLQSGPDEVDEYEEVVIYDGPLNGASQGIRVNLYRDAKTATLGSARPIYADSVIQHYLGDQPKVGEYRLTFDAVLDAPSTIPRWNNPVSRIVYAYEGFTTVTINGQVHALGSPEALAALNTPGLSWGAVYRETWCSEPYGTYNPWVVLNLFVCN